MFSNTILGDVLKSLPRDFVDKSVERFNSDRWYKKFKTWDQLVAMLSAQFSGVTSLRELETLLGNNPSSHYHLRLSSVSKSTLSDANKGRNAAVFGDIAQQLIAHTNFQKNEITEVLSVLDSSLIYLGGHGYEWAKKTRARGAASGLKLHIQMNYDSSDLEYAEITATNVNDITQAQTLPLEAGRTYVFDKGYCDYGWWHKIMENGSDFVSRIKKNARYETLENRAICEQDEGRILKDQVITLTNRKPRGKAQNLLAGQLLRLIEIPHPGGGKTPFLIVSSHLDKSASEVAQFYKKRWSIELLFKWIKQNLKIKRFMGRSKNAVMIQIYVALIAYILLHTHNKLTTKERPQRLKDTLTALRYNLFSRPQMYERRQNQRDKATENQLELWSLA